MAGYWYACGADIYESTGSTLAAIKLSDMSATDWEGAIAMGPRKTRLREIVDRWDLEGGCIHSSDKAEEFAREVVEAVVEHLNRGPFRDWNIKPVVDYIADEFLGPRE